MATAGSCQSRTGPSARRSSSSYAVDEDLDAALAVLRRAVVPPGPGPDAAQHRREDGAREEGARDRRVEPRPRLAGPRGPAQALHERSAHRPEDPLEGLVLAEGVAVDLA